MALSIKSAKTDHLARQLAGLTGETLTQAVTVALQERLDRVERERGLRREHRASGILATAAALRARYDIRPVRKDERDAAAGDG